MSLYTQYVGIQLVCRIYSGRRQNTDYGTRVRPGTRDTFDPEPRGSIASCRRETIRLRIFLPSSRSPRLNRCCPPRASSPSLANPPSRARPLPTAMSMARSTEWATDGLNERLFGVVGWLAVELTRRNVNGATHRCWKLSPSSAFTGRPSALLTTPISSTRLLCEPVRRCSDRATVE